MSLDAPSEKWRNWSSCSWKQQSPDNGMVAKFGNSFLDEIQIGLNATSEKWENGFPERKDWRKGRLPNLVTLSRICHCWAPPVQILSYKVFNLILICKVHWKEWLPNLVTLSYKKTKWLKNIQVRNEQWITRKKILNKMRVTKFGNSFLDEIKMSLDVPSEKCEMDC